MVDFPKVLPLLLEPSPSSLEDLAVCKFFSNFVLVPHHHEAFRGILDVLPPLFNIAPSGSVLALATSAVSLAIVGGSPFRPREAILSRQKFGKALIMARQAIDDSVESLKDETLLAVLVLSLYEVSKLMHIFEFNFTIGKVLSRFWNEAPECDNEWKFSFSSIPGLETIC